MKLENIYSYPFFHIFNFFNFLQYCVGFCCKTTWIPHNCLYIPSLWGPPSHPSRLSQSPRLDSLYYRAASYWLSILHLYPSLNNYKESLSAISVFVFFLLYISLLQIQHKVCYIYNRKSWLSPSVRVHSSFPKKSKGLFHSLEENNIEILWIIFPPSLLLSPTEKGMTHLVDKIFWEFDIHHGTFLWGRSSIY